MIERIFLLLLFLVAIPFAARAVRVHLDARAHALSWLEGLKWALVALFDPTRYWWDQRLEVLDKAEAERLLAKETREMGLKGVTNLLCPLCGQEMEGVLGLSSAGALSVKGREVICDRCGFRLDCCRHCRHFIPGGGMDFSMGFQGGEDRTRGKCSHHREWRPVTEACPPHMSRRLMEMGYESLRVQAVIQDSYVPLEGCRAFVLDEEGLRKTGAQGIDRKRMGLIRLWERLK
ncbi:MAG: hypothetical protein ACETWB_02495 [Anaerolineae bacterium]